MPFVFGSSRVTEGTLQITDLHPHKTQSNAVLTPNFRGPAYIYSPSQASLATLPVLDANFDTNGDQSGLALYLLATIDDDANGNVLISEADARSVALALIARAEAGLDLTEGSINQTILNTTGDANGIGIGGSTATVEEILSIISGYSVFEISDGFSLGGALRVFEGPNVAPFFSTPSWASRQIRTFDGSFFISAREGQLKSAQTRLDSAGVAAPFAVCYADDGSLIQ